METILAYAPSKGSAFRAERVGSPSFRVTSNPKQLEREIRRFKPRFVLGDQSRSQELLRIVGKRAAVVMVDASAQEQVWQVVRILEWAQFSEVPIDFGQKASLAGAQRTAPVTTGISALHDPKTGRLDAVRVARWLGVSLNRFARFLGRPVQTIHKTPASTGLQPLLSPYERIAASLLSLFKTRARARIWLNAPHPDLDEATPMSVLGQQKADVVAELLEDALLGQPG